MWSKTIVVGAFICMAFAQTANDDKAKKDLEQLQGKWSMHALEINGKEVPPRQIVETFLEVKGDVYRTIVKKKEHLGLRIKLNAGKNPREIDMILSEGGSTKVFKGIYAVDKDEFKMCRAASPENERPTQFATWPDTNYFVVTWKKLPK